MCNSEPARRTALIVLGCLLERIPSAPSVVAIMADGFIKLDTVSEFPEDSSTEPNAPTPDPITEPTFNANPQATHGLPVSLASQPSSELLGAETVATAPPSTTRPFGYSDLVLGLLIVVMLRVFWVRQR
eukprot:CAMPEP_0174734156 /NCGR_PEP_ID=MMETSP1094-20130205/62720_1 /TAXON_ID=156173 /ORGANISM="Chrysochromulina brevifilum, Strain UTEX LB 985" /LENGTH=128 /DNA_ID=CAMNT_0015936925 /DNA_START=1 /DNA_END=384 /DNA_ORIENTATION=+